MFNNLITPFSHSTLQYATTHECSYNSGYRVMMGSIEENRYQYIIDTLANVSIVSIRVSILVSILRYPSENPYHKLHIHKLVTYFEVFRLSDLEFFRFLQHLSHFCPISGYFVLDFFLAFLFTISLTIPSIDT